MQTARRPILGAAIATAIATAILIALGVWQLQRLAWKNGILAQIDAAEAAPPHPIGPATPPLFARVTTQGTLSPALGAPNAAPYILVAMGPAGNGPIPAETLPRPVNNHLQYALTWFGLAGALLGVFIVWARPRKS